MEDLNAAAMTILKWIFIKYVPRVKPWTGFYHLGKGPGDALEVLRKVRDFITSCVAIGFTGAALLRAKLNEQLHKLIKNTLKY